jgi:hypothetical protein
MALNFGQIFVIDETTNTNLSFIDLILDFLFADTTTTKTHNIIFQMGLTNSDNELIDLQTLPIETKLKYDTSRLIKKYNCPLPLYINMCFSKETLFEIIPSNKIVPDHPTIPIGNIDFETESTKIYGSISKEKIIFGVWKLKTQPNSYLIGWDSEIIPKDFLLYLLNWIFVKNTIKNGL